MCLWGLITRELSKYFDVSPSPWTEEVATNLLIWVSLLGAAVAYERNEHLGLDYLVTKFDRELQRVMAMISHGIVVAFAAATLVFGGGVLVYKTLASGQVTPALGMKMGLIYLAAPVSGAADRALWPASHLPDRHGGMRPLPQPRRACTRTSPRRVRWKRKSSSWLSASWPCC